MAERDSDGAMAGNRDERVRMQAGKLTAIRLRYAIMLAQRRPPHRAYGPGGRSG